MYEGVRFLLKRQRPCCKLLAVSLPPAYSTTLFSRLRPEPTLCKICRCAPRRCCPVLKATLSDRHSCCTNVPIRSNARRKLVALAATIVPVPESSCSGEKLGSSTYVFVLAWKCSLCWSLLNYRRLAMLAITVFLLSVCLFITSYPIYVLFIQKARKTTLQNDKIFGFHILLLMLFYFWLYLIFKLNGNRF